MKSAKQFSNQGNALDTAKGNMSTPEYLLNNLNQQNLTSDYVAQVLDSLPPGQIVRYFAQNGLEALFEQQEETTEENYGSNATALELNTALDASIDTEMENDLYSIELEEGENYSFTVTSDELSSPYLVLRNSDGERISSDIQEDGETNTSFSFTAPQSGIFFLDLSDLEDDASGSYNISVTASDDTDPVDETEDPQDGSETDPVDETEDPQDGSETDPVEETPDDTVAEDFTADTTTAGAIVANTEVQGTFEQAGDSDWYSMSLEAGTDYTMTFSSENVEIPALVLRDAEGQTVENNFSITGDDVDISFTAEEAGAYFLDASDLSSAAIGDYTLALTTDEQDTIEIPELDEDDVSADILTTSLLDVGSTVESSLDFAGDEDWFATSLEAGMTYDISMESDALESGQLAVMDNDGELALALEEGNEDGILSFTAEESGTYFIGASDANPDATGDYLIGVQQQTTEDVIA
ncbi:MAG: PPC domain-containing protein [Marinomonas gallaica]